LESNIRKISALRNTTTDKVKTNNNTRKQRNKMGIRKDRKELRQHSAELIKQARVKNNCSQMKLAALLSVSQPLVSSWECGKVTASIDDLVAIEQALEIPAGQLLNAVAYPSVA